MCISKFHISPEVACDGMAQNKGKMEHELWKSGDCRAEFFRVLTLFS